MSWLISRGKRSGKRYHVIALRRPGEADVEQHNVWALARPLRRWGYVLRWTGKTLRVRPISSPRP